MAQVDVFDKANRLSTEFTFAPYLANDSGHLNIQSNEGLKHIKVIICSFTSTQQNYTSSVMTITIRIGMLNADVPVPNVYSQRATTYGQIFHELISAAAQKLSPDITIESSDFDVMKGEYPGSLDDFDALFISGSANSAYDDLDWIRKLDRYVLEAYQENPHVKIFGSCFGHQLMCQSLLKEHGVKVEKDPKGWEIGVKEIELDQEFLKSFGRTQRALEVQDNIPDKLRLQFVHHDHVVIPESLPPSWKTIGRTKHCAVQGVYEPGRILTTQGHFEFDKFVNTETAKHFFQTWTPNALEETLEQIDAEDDALTVASMVLKFLLETSVNSRKAPRATVGGLLTPPLNE